MTTVIQPRDERTQPSRIVAGHGDKQAIGQLIHLKVRVQDEDGVPVLRAVPPSRQRLLISKAEEPGLHLFNIRLRGKDETPFFDD